MTVNVTISLADRFAAAKEAYEAASSAFEALKDEVKELGQERVFGITCDLVLSLVEQRRVDTKKLKELLTEEQIEACKSTYLSERITVKAKGLK